MQLPVAIIAFIAPTLAYATGGVSWQFPGASPDTGLQDVSFGINMDGSPHDDGWYYAQQYGFLDNPNIGYTGLQPRKDNDEGQSIVHAVFSSFQAGTTTASPKCPKDPKEAVLGQGCCHYGADGGAGVSCYVDFPGDYSHTYNLTIERSGAADNRTWLGQVVDATTGVSYIIGEWTLPNATRGIIPVEGGFVEYYKFNSVFNAEAAEAANDPDAAHKPETANMPDEANKSDTPARPLDCKRPRDAAVTFFNPTSLTPDAGPGTVFDANDYGDCAGESNFAASTLPDGIHIEIHVPAVAASQAA